MNELKPSCGNVSADAAQGSSAALKLVSLAILLALLAGWAVLALQTQGVGLESDSISYFAFAETGDWGDLPVHHGILYALMLRWAAVWVDVRSAALAINVLLSFLTIFTMACCSGLLLERSGRAALFSGVLLMLSYSFLSVHAAAMSEPLFMFISISALFLLAGRDSRASAMSAAVLCGLAGLTRYVGVVLGAVGVLWMLHREGRRWWRACILAAISWGPLAMVLLWNRMRSGTTFNRDPAVHLPTWETVQEGMLTLLSCILPYRVCLVLSPWLQALGAAAVMAGPLLLIRRSEAGSSWVRVTALFVALYLAFVFIAMTFVEGGPLLNHRYLSPVVAVLVPSWCLAGIALHDRSRRKVIRIGLLAGLVYLAGFSGYRAVAYVAATAREGTGYASVAWRNSPTLKAVVELAGRSRIYSNAPDAIYLVAGLRTSVLPQRMSQASHRPNPHLAAELRSLRDEVVSGGAVIVEFDARFWPPYLVQKDELLSSIGPVACTEYDDGRIYRVEAVTVDPPKGSR